MRRRLIDETPINPPVSAAVARATAITRYREMRAAYWRTEPDRRSPSDGGHLI